MSISLSLKYLPGGRDFFRFRFLCILSTICFSDTWEMHSFQQNCLHHVLQPSEIWGNTMQVCMWSVTQQPRCIELKAFLHLQSCRTPWSRFCRHWGSRVSVCTSCQRAAASRASTLCLTGFPRPQMSLCPGSSELTSTSEALLCTSTRRAPQVFPETPLKHTATDKVKQSAAIVSTHSC